MQTYFCEWRKDGCFKIDDPVHYETDGRRITFTRLPFRFKEDIKCMAGAAWDNVKRQWRVTDCPRNHFQLDWLKGINRYAPFEKPIKQHEFREYRKQGVPCTPYSYQIEIANTLLTRHTQIIAARMRAGKTLAAQMVMEHGVAERWWWVCPPRTVPNVKREFEWWELDPRIQVEYMSYEALQQKLLLRKSDDELPQGVIFDEAQKAKTASSKRSMACQELCDLMRGHYGSESIYIGLLSGTPSPKTPLDIWSLAEIACPGFLKEGSPAALEKRIAFMELKSHDDGKYLSRIGWKDDARKCATCGEFPEQHGSRHEYQPSVNEVARLSQRLKGLMLTYLDKDCVALPAVEYIQLRCPPSTSLLRAAKAIAGSAAHAAQGAIWLRELSDGFQYREQQDGTKPCKDCTDGKLTVAFQDGQPVSGACETCKGTGEAPNMVRVAKEVPCPKDQELSDVLEQTEDDGRIVIYAGFSASIDRCQKLCQKRGWSVVRSDGRGYAVFDPSGYPLVVKNPLEYWSDMKHPRVAYVANPESGGVGLNLSEASVTFYYSNSTKAEARPQSEARTQAPGKHCVIYDCFHLPTDERLVSILKENRRLELMTMGDFVADSLEIAG